MSETHEEAVQNAIDISAGLQKEYILSNGAELYQFFMDNLETVEEIANLMSMHWNDKSMGDIIKQQLNNDLDQECGDQARERLFG